MRPASVRYAFTDIGTSKTHAQIFDSDAMNATSNEMCAQRWERMRESLPKLKIFYGASVNLTNSWRHRQRWIAAFFSCASAARKMHPLIPR